MKKIVPFNNVLNFSTDVCEITAISLEHDIEKSSDIISGSFYISGEYKMTDGELRRETFDFELPFDIALGNNYDLNTLLVDIDDFRYELIDRNKLKVNIDMYIDGETIEIPIQEEINTEELRNYQEDYKINDDLEECSEEENTINNEELSNIEEIPEIEEPIQIPIPKRIDLFEEMLESTKEEPMEEENININENNNIFNSFNEEEKYVTYHVYRVLDTDTIDKILEKYQVSKEELSKYNNIEDLKPGDKLIIPANDK